MRGGWRRFLPLLLGSLVVFGRADRARADETAMVHIRARSQLRLHEGERGRAKDGLRVSITVQLDDNQPSDGEDRADRSFAGQRVRVELADENGAIRSETLTTDASGAASHRFDKLAHGRYRLTAHYDGDEERDRSAAFLDIDLERRPSQIVLEAPSSVGSKESLAVKLSLRTTDRAIAGMVTLQLGDALRKALQIGEAGYTETVRLSPPPRPGTIYKLEARFAGDDEFAPTFAEQEVLITTQATITLEAESAAHPNRATSASDGVEAPQAGKLTLRGTVFDESGALPGETIDIEVDSGGEKHHLGSALSDENGRYELILPKLHLRVGGAFLVSQVTPRRHHILPGRSAELQLTVLPPEPVSLLYFLLPLVASALALLGILFVRAIKPRLASWIAALRERFSREPATTQAGDAAARNQARALQATGEAGVQLGSQKSSLTLRRTVDATIDGVVCDAVFGPPIAGASLSLAEGAGRATRSDADGRFVLQQLPPGRYSILVRAPGFLDEEFTASVPHRGELRGIMVRLMPLRARIFAEWQRVAELFYGEKTELAAKTPHELYLDAQEPLPNKRSSGAPIGDLRRLQRLTSLVEQGYYSQTLCTNEMLDEAIALAAALCRPAPGAAVVAPPTSPVSGGRDIRAPGAPRPLESR